MSITPIEIRLQAVQKVLSGIPQKTVAKSIGVQRQTVSKWVAKYRANGDGGLVDTMHFSHSYLTPEQEQQVIRWLSREPKEYGFRFKRWTARHVAALIYHKYGITYRPRSLHSWLTKRRPLK